LDEKNAIEFNPQMSRASERMFVRYRLLMMAGLLIGMLAAAILAR
jgi:hypothetical protein